VRARLTLRTRLLLSFVLVMGVPLLIVSTLTNALYTGTVVRMTIDQKRELLLASVEEIGLRRGEAEQVSNQILLNDTFQSSLRDPAPEAAEMDLLRTKAFNKLLFSLQAPTSLAGVLIMDRGGRTYQSSSSFGSRDTLPLLEELTAEPAFQSSRGRNIWISLPSNVLTASLEKREMQVPYLYLLRRINDVKRTRHEIGTLVLQFPYATMAAALDRTSRGPGEYAILADGGGRVLARSGGSDGIGEPLPPALAAAWGSLMGHNEPSATLSGDAGITQFHRLPDADWTVIQYTPRSNFYARFRQVQFITFGVLALFLAAALLASYLLSREITQPITHLSGVIRAFGHGRIDARVSSDREDEIGRLEGAFNTMAEDIRSLLKRIDEEHVQRRKLELTMLEYQINPHFLYNILDSVNWMAQKAGQPEIGALVTALARFFRIGLSGGRDYISVAEELEHARNFLIICQARSRDGFRYAVECEDGVSRCRTLKILLQPVIENALKHGLDGSQPGGLVTVRCRADGDDVLFSVTDNGRGIPEPTLARIRDTLARGLDADASEDGIGLTNLQQRVRLGYGDGYGVAIESVGGGGTTVLIRIPRTNV
jgi:two-component system, sensor histidine kinase YesM